MPVWAIFIIVAAFFFAFGGLIFCVCKKFIKKNQGKDAKKAAGFMKGEIAESTKLK